MTLTELRQPTALRVTVSLDRPATIVALAGEADTFTLADVVTALARAIGDSDGPVVVDLAQTDFIDTGTVRALGRAGQFLADRGRLFSVRSPSRLAVRIFAILNLTHLIEPPA